MSISRLIPDLRISWTISWYIFKDLLKIFLMTSGALAGIMSFGGLLRPLTQQGLDAGQVSQLLTYFTPAMTAYSLPIAALFAATVVYGRLSADNELTACRAGGISHLSVAVPAFVLGLLAALISLLLLSFIVPSATLKVEKVIYSNIAKLIANKIDRVHQIKFGQATVFAQDAYLPALSADRVAGGEQQVVLVGPTIVTFDRPKGRDDWQYRVPAEFWTASKATVFISRGRTDDTVELTIELKNGAKFPRDFRKGGLQGGVAATHFGPIEISSPIKENSKFMTLGQLQTLYANQGESRKVQRLKDEFIDRYQMFSLLWNARNDMNERDSVRFRSLSGEEFELTRGPVSTYERGGVLIVPGTADDGAPATTTQVAGAGDPAGADRPRPVTLMRAVRQASVSAAGDPGAGGLDEARVDAVINAAEARIYARPRRDQDRADVTIEMRDTVIPAEEGLIRKAAVTYQFSVAMPPNVRELENLPLDWFIAEGAKPYDPSNIQLQLHRELMILNNDLLGEMNARASFAVSCAVLVAVGCALGMMFRSGNFLTAFAVSFVPALLSITLIIAGQRVGESIGWKIYDPGFTNPLKLALTLIWSGNVVNLIVGVVLFTRLQRT